MTDLDGSQRMRQTLAGLLCVLGLFLIAWNEVPGSTGETLVAWFAQVLHPQLASPAVHGALRLLAALLALGGCFFCIAGMGNTLGLIPLFGGRVALSARLAGAALGGLLTLAAAVLGHLSSTLAVATLSVTPLAATLLALLWLSRREPMSPPRHSGGAPAPLLLDLPDRTPAVTPERDRRQEPTLPTPPVRSSQPATFTARAPRQADGHIDLSPLDFDRGSHSPTGRGRPASTSGPDLGLPPLEFTPSAAPGKPTSPSASRSPGTTPPPASTPRPPPLRIDDGLPPLDFPGARAAPAPAPVPAPVPPRPSTPPPAAAAERLTLDTLDFMPATRRPVAAPLADELAQWSPRPPSAAAPPPVRAMPVAAPPPPAPRPPTPASPTTRIPPPAPAPEPPTGDLPFTLDTVAPRELGPRRALLDEEPDLLAQLGSLAQVRTPPSAPVPSTGLPLPPPTRPEPQRIKLADKGVFSIYKVVENGTVTSYALTEQGVTVATGTQEQVKQALRERWPGTR